MKNRFLIFLKANQGKELFEIMVLIPFTIFLILYTTINVVCYVIRSNVEDITTDYARSAVTERTFYDALCSMASEVKTTMPEDLDEESIIGTTVTILEIKIISKDGTKEASLSFSNNPDETTYFTNLISFKNNVPSFHFNISESFKNEYIAVNDLWEKGNYLIIKTQKSVIPIINEVSKVTIYNASTRESTTFDYGMSGLINCTVTSMIIS